MTLKNQSIICFAPEPWDSMWRNRHQIMSRFSSTNKVLYIEPEKYSLRLALGLLMKLLTGKSIKSDRLEHKSKGLWIYRHTPWGIDTQLPVLKQIGLALSSFSIHLAMRKLGMHSPILWIVDPRFGNIIRYFKKTFICFHVVDNYSASPYYSDKVRKELKQAEKIMLSIADLVIVTSPFLYEEKRKYNNNVHLVKNAVDFEKFTGSSDISRPPQDMKNLPKPVIGYIGALNEKLDYVLLDTIARAKPKWSFVFVGYYSKKSGSPAHDLASKNLPNVFFLGNRNVKDIPQYVHACDVCIMPYRRDDYTKGIDSLKLYEYFACEKPVIATDIPAIRDYSELVYVANNENDFIHKLEEALKSHTPDLQSQQRFVAMNNTWDNRVEQLSSLIGSSLIKFEKNTGSCHQRPDQSKIDVL